MPSPSAYQSPPPANAWQQQQESTKTLDEPTYNTNAYQYTGTPYGNSPTVASAYSPQPVHTENTTSNDINVPSTKPESISPAVRTKPSKLRVLFRFILFIFAVGYLGFAAGASPFSGESIPFDSKICFYYLFAVAVMSIIWSGFHLFLYLFRRFGSTDKMKRFILILCDLFMAAMWGIGIIVELIQYRCSPGGHNHWCDFYNTSIFFGFTSFALYIVLVGWDFVGGCKSRKK
ncbi:unnamed protein product [Rhizopus stolonifer]